MQKFDKIIQITHIYSRDATVTSGNRDNHLASRSVLSDFTDDLSRQFFPKWDSSNAESVLVTLIKTSVVVNLIGMAA